MPATRRSARKYARICKESGEKATEFSPTEESSLELEKQDSLNSDEDMIDMTNTHLKSNKYVLFRGYNWLRMQERLFSEDGKPKGVELKRH